MEVPRRFVHNVRMDMKVKRAKAGPASSDAWASIQYPTVACATCEMCELWCQPIRENPSGYNSLNWFRNRRTKIRRGEYLFHGGEPFKCLYVLRTGFLKVFFVSQGREHVTGFYMAGELVGLDAIHAARHNCSAIALEDGQVCEVPFKQLEKLCLDLPSSMHRLHQFMSREITRHYEMVAEMVGKTVEERLAAFLLNLSKRYGEHGYPADRFQLCMKRDEIGNYLGMTLETVSRTLRKFAASGLISCHGRQVDLLDLEGLRRAANSDE
jgi:CRP/FNR family transcriptional regulator